MKSRLLIITIFGGVLVAIGWVGAIRAHQASEVEAAVTVAPAPVRCVKLQERPYQVTASLYGLIEANARVDMAFQIPGRVVQLGVTKDKPVVENQFVRKGDIIAKIEPLRYEAAVQQAQAAVDEAKAAMATAQAMIAQAQVRYDDALREVERYRQLQNRQAANVREVEKAELQLKMAEADLDTAQAKMASSNAAYTAARAAVTMAGVNLQDSILRAPMDATVAAVPVEIGQMISPGQPIVTLVDMNKAKLVLGVVEQRLPMLQKGQKVTVEVRALMSQAKLLSDSEALGRPREAFVTMVPPTADPATGLFHVEVEMDNADGLLRPGMIGKATIEVMEKTVYAVPASAAMRSGDRASAYFVQAGYKTGLDLGPIGKAQVEVPANVARRVWFEPLAFDKDYYLLTELPDELDTLVVEGQNRLKDGQPVRLMENLADAGG